MEKGEIEKILKKQKIKEFYERQDVSELIAYLYKFKNNFNSEKLSGEGIKSFKIVFEDNSDFKTVNIL